MFLRRSRKDAPKDEGEEEYEYYEEYYDEDDEPDDCNAADNCEEPHEDEELDDFDEDCSNHEDSANNKHRGSSKNLTRRFFKNTNTKKEKKSNSRRFMSKGAASFVPSLRSSSRHHSITYGGGGSSFGFGGTSATTSARTALLSSTTSILSTYISKFYTFILSSLLQPTFSTLNSITCHTYYWITHSIRLLTDVFEVIWYGPGIDGITTTGVITGRYGGLKGVIFGSSTGMVVTAVIAVGLISWMVNNAVSLISSSDDADSSSKDSKREIIFRPWIWWRKGRRSNNNCNVNVDEDDVGDDAANPHFSLDPPTVDEELQFLSKTFKSANPTSKQRISENISTNQSGGLLRHFTNRFVVDQKSSRRSRKSSPRRQRKVTIKSIQKWWKRDDNKINGGQPINIIKPNNNNYSNSNNKNQSITQLQNQLQKSEQERHLLENDIQKLQFRLQKAQADARDIITQNKWLEKQASRADQILSRAVEVERKKANEEVERVRGEMRGVLERERLMMRGNNSNGVVDSGRRVIGGENDIDLNRGPTKRLLDGVKIVRDVDDYDDGDDMLDERGRPPWRAM